QEHGDARLFGEPGPGGPARHRGHGQDPQEHGADPPVTGADAGGGHGSPWTGRTGGRTDRRRNDGRRRTTGGGTACQAAPGDADAHTRAARHPRTPHGPYTPPRPGARSPTVPRNRENASRRPPVP